MGKGISFGNFLQFYLDCYIGSNGNPHSKCLYGSTNLHDSGSYAPGQAEVCVSLPTSGVGKGISSGNFLKFYLDCYIGSPGNLHSECLYGSTNLHDSGSYAPGQAEVCFLTDFRCGKGGLFRHPGETVRILQSVVVARAHHVAVVIAGRALTPAKHTGLFIISALRIGIRDPVPF